MNPFNTPLQHILAELERIDLLIRVQVWRARQTQQIDEHFQGLYIADEEVDALLASPAGLPRWAQEDGLLPRADVTETLDRYASQIEQRKHDARHAGIELPLERLVQLFGLSRREVDILLICLAPEIDLRYERLFGYLQDDITKKRPSVDLVLNLLSSDLSDKLEGRRVFFASAPLMRHHLLTMFEDPSLPKPTMLGRFLRVDERIVDYLLGNHVWHDMDLRLAPYAQAIEAVHPLTVLTLPDELMRRLEVLTQKHGSGADSVIFHISGAYGTGKRSLAETLAHMMARRLLIVNMEALLESEATDFELSLKLLQREAYLRDSILLWEEIDALFGDGRARWLQAFVQALEETQSTTILSGHSPWEATTALRERPIVNIKLPTPTYAQRRALWSAATCDALTPEATMDLDALASRFRFTAGQIKDAAVTARNLALLRDPESLRVTPTDLFEACRLHSNRKLSDLAQKVTPRYRWDDIILPEDRKELLCEIVGHVRHHACVYDEWGFGRKFAMGKGLNVLFAGPSGTGKTMAAEVMANELGLDLYKIDLSSVVSKYIGETEKNLARIFTEAETSNAILFFDEADALFGRRSEVRDSHDRYANIEISYLLQRMEEYEGMAILATNLHKNMDEAFVRRMHFTVEFPLPDAAHRKRIWEKLWPPETPCNHPLDLDFMAQRFEIAGGSIRNIVLAAAFLAAGDGRVVTMEHLVQATQREYQKMGKVMIEGEFGQYARRTLY